MGAAAAGLLFAYSRGVPEGRPRAIELAETVTVAVPPGARELRLWIPKPPDAGPQAAELIAVESLLPYRITSEPEFGNETVFIAADRPIQPSLEIKLRYRITRKPQASIHTGQEPGETYRAPRGLLAVNDEIREIARRQTWGITDPMEKGRALYRYVLRRMTYRPAKDSSTRREGSGVGSGDLSPAWGRGDSIYACRVGKGNCTDFHSLFMALAMAGEIPARFRMGLSLPQAPEGTVSGYHCWAEFYARGSWIPVDISEAWKKPGRAEYYFGHLDVNRVLVSTGREIRLSPPQQGPALNFFHRPYAEADGKPVRDIQFIRNYRNIPEPA